MVPPHVVTQGHVEIGPGDVQGLPDVVADGGELLDEESGFLRSARPFELHQSDAKLFPLDEGLPVGKVGAGHSHVVDLVRAGGQADVLVGANLYTESKAICSFTSVP